MMNQKQKRPQRNDGALPERSVMQARFRPFLAVAAVIWTFAGLLGASPSISFAQELTREVTELRQVPSSLSEVLQTQLSDSKRKLVERLDLLNKKFDYFSQGVCTKGVEEGSAEDAYCQATYDRLNKKLDAYDADAKKFNRRIGLEEGKALLLGYAFKMGAKMRAYAHQSLKSVKDTSRVLLSIWYAERGDYQRARHFIALPDNVVADLQDMDALLRSLEKKKRALLKTAIPRIVVSGDFNTRLFSRYPKKFSLSLLRAHLNIKSHNYDEALKQIALARGMHIESPALADAALYVRQMKASAMAKKSPPNPALIKHQANMASAYAGWSLGMLMLDADTDMDTPAVLVLAKSAKALAREGNIDDSKTVFGLVNHISEGRKKFSSSGVYDTASEANILLDAVEYGNKDWQRSMQFLNIAHKAAPNNERISEAIAHVQALMASQE